MKVVGTLAFAVVASGGVVSFINEAKAEPSNQYITGDYEDCVVTYDAQKGESKGSGTNVIKIRSSNNTWTVSYSFGDGNYLMSGSGNLEGKSINVRFDGGRPASLKSSYGSGHCTVNSASKE